MLPKKNCFLLFKRCLGIVISVGVFLWLINVLRNYQTKHVPAAFVRQDNDTAVTMKATNSSSKVTLIPKPTHYLATPVNYRVHTFYYPWYSNPADDLQYAHWNHEYIPNWDKKDQTVYPTGRHQPPDDIGANFYPLLGCYSSKNDETIDQHMRWISEAGIGVAVITWYPPEQADKEGKPFDQLFPKYLDMAGKFQLKVAFHIEPYEGRTPANLRSNLEYIIAKYGSHPSMYKMSKSMTSKPLPGWGCRSFSQNFGSLPY